MQTVSFSTVQFRQVTVLEHGWETASIPGAGHLFRYVTNQPP